MFSFQEQKNRTSIIEAAASGHYEIVIVMLRNNFNVNQKCENGETALMVVSAGGYLDVVNALLSHGANINEHNVIGHTPLMKAACPGHVEVAKVLLERGAEINNRSNEYYESALSVASYKGHIDMVRFLLQAGADHLNFALSAASTGGQMEVVHCHRRSNVQLTIVTLRLPLCSSRPAATLMGPITNGNTVSHDGSWQGTVAASVLLSYGVNPEHKTEDNRTPLVEASRAGHLTTVNLLIEKGARK